MSIYSQRERTQSEYQTEAHFHLSNEVYEFFFWNTEAEEKAIVDALTDLIRDVSEIRTKAIEEGQ